MRFTAVFLIALVGMSLASQYVSPADRVMGKVDELVTASRNEQAEQSRIYAVQAARCKSEREYRTKEINDASVAAGSANQQLQICKAEKPIAVAAKKQSKAELQATAEQLRALDLEFALFQQVNDERYKEHLEAINNIQGAYNIIGNFANGKEALNNKALFVEVSSKINAVFKLAIKHKFHHHMVPVMSALVQVTQKPATTVSTSALTRVVQLLKQLEANVRASEVARDAEWKQYQKEFQSSKSLLLLQQVSLKKIIQQFKQYISNLNTCIRTEKNIFKLASTKLARNEHILQATYEMCNAYDAKYRLQTEQRTEYVALLTNLRQFIVATISQFKSGLYSRNDFVNQAQISK